MKSNKFEKYSFNKATVELERVQFNSLEEQKTTEIVPIIFDTNFLFVTFEFNIDLIAQIERLVGTKTQFYIYAGTLSELENIERKGDKNKKFLPLITTMFRRYNFKIIESEQNYIDDQILENSSKGILVATNDKELRQLLWKVPCRVLYMRQKSYLEIK